MLRLVCPICSSSCTIVDESTRTVSCPTCGKSFTVDTSRRSGTEEGDSSSNIEEETTAGWVAEEIPDVEQPELDEIVGKYQLVREIGRGGFGIVYLARDLRLQRNVALKIANRHRESSLEIPNEARIAAQLRHPGIATVLDLGNAEDNRWYFVTDFVPGRSLHELMRSGRLPLMQSIALMAKVARAIHHAHKHGVVHRDLKPSNILMDEMGEPKIVDFGLAVHEATQHLQRGEVAGTPSYMAPEQVQGEAHHIDGRTDEWSFGCILYELLTFRKAFSKSGKALFDEIRYRSPKPPRQINDAVPKQLEQICLRCLEKEVKDRYPSMLDVAELLEDWVAQNNVSLGNSRHAVSAVGSVDHVNALAIADQDEAEAAARKDHPNQEEARTNSVSSTSNKNRKRSLLIAGSLGFLFVFAAIAISMRPQRDRYHEPIESRISPGNWQDIPMDGVEPKVIGFTISVRSGHWSFDRSSRVISMDSNEVGIIGLGTTKLPYYQIQADLSRTQWQSRGDAGIFFGCKSTTLANGEDGWVMQSVDIAIKRDGRTFLSRSISEIWLSPAGSPMGNGRTLASVQIPPMTQNPATLDVTLFGGQLASVRLNGREYPELLSVNADGKKHLIDGAGEFGVANVGGASRFSNFRFINLRRKQP